MTTRARFMVLAVIVLGLSGAFVPRAPAQDDNAWIDAARQKPSPVTHTLAPPLPDRKPAHPPAKAATESGQQAAAKPHRAASATPLATDDSKAPVPAEPNTDETGSGGPEVDVSEDVEKDLLPQSARPTPREPESEKSATDAVVSALPGGEKAPSVNHEVSAVRPPQAPVVAAVAAKKEPEGSWPHEAEIAAPEAMKPAAELPKAARAAPEPHNAKAAVPLPVKKPAKPVRKPAHEDRRPEEKKRQPQKDAQTPKCVALRACRDAFAKCKQAYVKKTGEWDLEKEPCGAKYKACIKEHFAPGEMFFTRYFWPFDVCPEKKDR